MPKGNRSSKSGGGKKVASISAQVTVNKNPSPFTAGQSKSKSK